MAEAGPRVGTGHGRGRGLYLLCDIGVHAVVLLPGVLCGIDIETCTSPKVPALLLPLDVTTTWEAKRESVGRRKQVWDTVLLQSQ